MSHKITWRSNPTESKNMKPSKRIETQQPKTSYSILSLSLPSLTHHSPFHLHSLSRRSQRRHFILRRRLAPRSHHSPWLIRVGQVRLWVRLTSQVQGQAQPWLLALNLRTWLLLLHLDPTWSSPRLGVWFALLLGSLEYGINSNFGWRMGDGGGGGRGRGDIEWGTCAHKVGARVSIWNGNDERERNKVAGFLFFCLGLIFMFFYSVVVIWGFFFQWVFFVFVSQENLWILRLRFALLGIWVWGLVRI